jgi:Tfp pilus tip-associated adhesin PilY1
MAAEKSKFLLSLSLLLLPSLGWAQQPSLPGLGNPVKPRVMIIFDTSTSMQVAPDDLYGVVYPMNQAGGDYDPTTPGAPCLSKFCIAKDVVYNTLPNYAAEARMGLATYFQFLVKYDSTNTQWSQCYYDKMWKQGYSGPETTFTSTTDYTGSIAVVPSTSLGPVFPNGSGLGALNGRCLDPTNGQNRHIVTKTAAVPGTVKNCGDFTYPPHAVPFSYASPAPIGYSPYTQCIAGTGTSYYAIYAQPVEVDQTNTSLQVVSSYTVNYINQGNGSSCPTAAVPGVNPPSYVLTNPTLGNSVGAWDGMNAGECPASAPCAMFSVSSMAKLDASKLHWYGLEPSPFQPATTPSNVKTNPAPSSAYSATRMTGTAVVQSGSACMYGPVGAAQSIDTNSSWSTWGFTLAQAQAFLPWNGQSFEATPGMPNPQCSPNLPCYLQLVSQSPGNQTWGSWSNINYNVPAAGATEQIQGPAPTVANNTNGGSQYRKTGACSGALLTTSATTVSGNTASTGWLPGYVPTGSRICSTGRQTCSFINPTNGTMSTGCASPVTRYDGTAPPACAGADQISHTYATSGSATTFTYSINVGVGGTCPAVGSLQTAPAPCSASSPCKVNTVLPGVGASMTSATTFNILAPPTGYSGPPTTTTAIADTTWSDPTAGSSPCPPVGNYNASDATVCGASGTPCTVMSNGLQNYGAPIGETQPKKCQYTRESFSWSAASVTCTITTPSQAYTTQSTFSYCGYDLQQYQLRTLSQPQVSCVYSAPVARHDYDQNSRKFCEFKRMMTVYTATPYTYTYNYRTSGGELVSYRTNATGNPFSNTPTQHTEYVNGKRLCDNPGAYNNSTGFPGGDCPPTIDNCDGNANHFCKLRWGQPSTTGTGRYAQVTSMDSRMCMAPDFGPTTAPWYVAPNYVGSGNIIANNTAEGTGTSTEPGAPTIAVGTTCQQGGAPLSTMYRLFSDWYDPTKSNTGATTANIGPLPTGYATATWNDQATKASGWSGTGGNTITPPTAAQLFVPIAQDADPTGGDTALRGALSKCELPSSSNVDPVTLKWTPKGACMVSDYYRNPTTTPAELRDFTPLYGSLKNTEKYLLDLKSSDPDVCRPYYVVLATDGLESTPAGYTASSLASQVTTMSSENINTFVIGFGNEVTGTASTSLDAMAKAGGTGAAYTAADRASLQTALSLVLNRITQGTFSRSKPTLSTDGTRIYAAQFTRASNSPEWKGQLYAYAIDPATGGLAQKWEYSDKLNGQPDTSRTIHTEVTGVEQNFDVTNATVLGQLTIDPQFPAGLTADKVVRFVRNPLVPSGVYETYFTTLSPAPPRTSRAGDILHSSAVIVSKPIAMADWGGSTQAQRDAYTTWQNSTANRPTRILFGADDGMLHALAEKADPTTYPACVADESDPNCPNGTEQWAFIPSGLHQNLYKSTMGYQAGVDNVVAVADICGQVISGAASDAAGCASTDWKTLALGSLRQGGRQIFAVHVRDDGTSKWLWNYTDGRLGNTWSAPAVGRVRVNNADHFAAVFGGGITPTGMTGMGNGLYVIDSLSGQEYGKWSGLGQSWNNIAARPVLFRRRSIAYVDSAVVGGIDGALQVIRFAGPDGNQLGTTAGWTPRPFFDPTRSADAKSVLGAPAPIMTVQTSGPSTAPVYTLVQVTTGDLTLPLTGTAPPIYNRAKLGAVWDPSGSTADYFVGTGDALNPSTPAYATNYFYALHDNNVQSSVSTAPHDGLPLWVLRLPNPSEQVVSEPGLIDGAVIFASYVPPSSGSQCSSNGDTYLYSLNPKTGALVNALVNPVSSPQAGQSTSVVKMSNVGIPSDVVIVNNTAYVATSNGGVTATRVKPQLGAGDMRSFRRLR